MRAPRKSRRRNFVKGERKDTESGGNNGTMRSFRECRSVSLIHPREQGESEREKESDEKEKSAAVRNGAREYQIPGIRGITKAEGREKERERGAHAARDKRVFPPRRRGSGGMKGGRVRAMKRRRASSRVSSALTALPPLVFFPLNP